MTTLYIYGSGGFGRQVLAPALVLLECERASAQPRFDGIAYLDDHAEGDALFGVAIHKSEHAVPGNPVVIAVADAALRQRLGERCRALGLSTIDFVAATALVAPQAQLGAGAVLCDHVIIEPGACIGAHFHGNIQSYVAHDCVIGDFVTFAPRVACNGHVHIGDYATIGAGAVIRQGVAGRPLVIGANAVVGMGAVVTRDVAAGATVIGNPARVRD